jgi:hypothetical protein
VAGAKDRARHHPRVTTAGAIAGPFIGPGHVGILVENKRTWVSVHFYDGTRKGMPIPAIRPLRWSDDGWPVAEENASGP